MVLSTFYRRVFNSFSRYQSFQIVNSFHVGFRSSSSKCLGGRIISVNRLGHRSYCVSEKLQEKWVTITLLRSDGSRFQRRGKVGSPIKELMEEAKDPDLEGYGMCSGSLLCATCQLIFPRETFEKLPKPCADEEDLLAFTNVSDRSRCGCAINVTEEMDGMVLEVPDRQC